MALFNIRRLMILFALALLGLMAYQLTVNVTNGHAWVRHGIEATEAQRCVRNNGTSAVMSEFNSRNLHLLCIDPNTSSLFDIIVSRVYNAMDGGKQADMITGYKPTTQDLSAYVKGMFDKAKLVNLHFEPGEINFFVR
jgi:hypothetical protein